MITLISRGTSLSCPFSVRGVMIANHHHYYAAPDAMDTLGRSNGHCGQAQRTNESERWAHRCATRMPCVVWVGFIAARDLWLDWLELGLKSCKRHKSAPVSWLFSHQLPPGVGLHVVLLGQVSAADWCRLGITVSPDNSPNPIALNPLSRIIFCLVHLPYLGMSVALQFDQLVALCSTAGELLC